jgi:hypothetical protein
MPRGSPPHDDKKSLPLSGRAKSNANLRPYKPGQSGNPAGGKFGGNELAAAARRKITPEIADELIDRFVSAARRGSTRAFSAIIKLLPKETPQRLLARSAPIGNAADAGKVMAKLADEMIAGKITIGQASAAVAVVGSALAGLSGSADLEFLVSQLETMRRRVDEMKNAAAGESDRPPLPWERPHMNGSDPHDEVAT